MKTEILEKLKKLSGKKIRLVAGNYEMNIEDSNMEVTNWSNEEQIKLKFSFSDNADGQYFSLITDSLAKELSVSTISEINKKMNEDFLYESLNRYLDEHISKTVELEELNISTDDFKIFKYNDGVNEIEFSDTKYYGAERAMSDIIDVIKLAQSEDKKSIVKNEKIFTKYNPNIKFMKINKKGEEVEAHTKISIYDFYLMVTNEPSIYAKNIFAFKEVFNEPYEEKLDLNIKDLEEKYNVNIILNPKGMSINLKNSDTFKNYTLKPGETLSEDFIKSSVNAFENMIKTDKKLMAYIAFVEKNPLPRGTYIAKSYGFGLSNIYNPTLEADEQAMKDTLSEAGVDFETEYSDAFWIKRYVVPVKNLKPKSKKSITKKVSKTDTVKK